jgi:hypothetical protein
MNRFNGPADDEKKAKKKPPKDDAARDKDAKDTKDKPV